MHQNKVHLLHQYKERLLLHFKVQTLVRLWVGDYMKAEEVLFSETRSRLLALLLLNPTHQYHLREIARQVDTGFSTLQRELDRLKKARIILSMKKQNKHFYRANTLHFVYPSLKELLDRTLGPMGVIHQALKPTEGKIEVAFIFGSIATDTAGIDSDVDLMIVGDVSLEKIICRLRKAEKQLNREINPSIFSADDFRERYLDESPFLLDIVEKPKKFIIGGEHELARLV